MTARLRTGALIAAPLAAILVAASACGSSGGSGSSGSDSGVSGKTIRIGISTPNTGPTASYGISADSMIAYLKSKNDSGGIDGYTFTFDSIDNQGTVSGGGLAMHQLLAKKPFVIESVTTAPFNGGVSVLKSTKSTVPVLAVASGGAIGAAGLDNAFGVLTDYTQESYYVLDQMITKRGYQKIALIYDPSINADAGSKDGAYIKSLGAQLVSSISVPTDATNMAPYVQQIINAKADAVLTMTGATLAGYFLKAARSQGVTIPAFGYSGDLDPSLLKIAGSAAEGYNLDEAYPPVDADTPEMQQFRDVTQKYAPDADSYFGTMGWNIGAIIAGAVQKVADAGQPMTQENFINALYGLDGQTVGFTKLSLTRAAHSTLIGQDGLSMYTVTNGKFVPAG